MYLIALSLFLVWALVPIVACKKFDPFEIINWFVLYFFLGIGVRGFFLIEDLTYNRYGAPIDSEGLVILVFLLSSACLVFLYLGYYSKIATNWGNRLAVAEIFRDMRGSGVAEFVSASCAVLGAVSLYIFYSWFSSFVAMADGPVNMKQADPGGGGMYIITVMSYFPTVGLLLILGKKRSLAKAVIVGANLAVLAAWYLISGGKWILVEPFIGAATIHHYLVRRFGKAHIAFMIPILLIIVFFSFHYKAYGFVGFNQWVDNLIHDDDLALQLISPLVERSYHFDMFLLVLSKVSGPGDLYFGSTVSELFYFFIPRAWWDTKPLSFSYTFASDFLDPGAYLNASFATSLPGELYLNFHVVGLAIGFLVLGVLMRIVYTGLTTRRSSLSIAVYCVLFARLVHMIEGPIAVHLIFLLAHLLPIIFYLGMRTLLSPRHRTAFNN